MKNGTLCGVYCEVPWIFSCHSIGHLCYLFALQIWPFSTCVTKCFCFTSPSTRYHSNFDKLKPLYLSGDIGKTTPEIKIYHPPTPPYTRLNFSRSNSQIKMTWSHHSTKHSSNLTPPVIFISITWPFLQLNVFGYWMQHHISVTKQRSLQWNELLLQSPKKPDNLPVSI